MIGLLWRFEAACRGLPEDVADAVFFPRSSAPEAAKRAKAICASCPVRAECAAEADHVEGRNRVALFGIFGGETPAERYKRRTGRRWSHLPAVDDSEAERLVEAMVELYPNDQPKVWNRTLRDARISVMRGEMTYKAYRRRLKAVQEQEATG